MGTRTRQLYSRRVIPLPPTIITFHDGNLSQNQMSQLSVKVIDRHNHEKKKKKND